MSKTFEVAVTHEVHYLRAGLEQIKDYLHSKELFWNTGLGTGEGGRAYPQLTLGNMLFSKQVVDAAGADPELVSQFEAIKQEWKTAWQTRADREFQLRLEAWREYIVYLKQSEDKDTRNFGTEVRLRALLELLKPEAPKVDDEMLRLLELEDQHLRSVWKSGDFIWDEDIAMAFPQENFWFLYGKPDPKK